MRTHRVGPLLLAALALTLPRATLALEPVYSSWRGLAIRGTDPVTYFTEHRPMAGSSEHTAEWKGATWRFVSAENRRRFLADPEAYAPQYGGYCAWAVSQGKSASSDPEAWDIVGGKLYLNYSKDIQKTWRQDVPGNIRRADENWPRVLAGE